MTPIKAIRAKCLDCCCGQVAEVRLCPCKSCPLYPYRFGKRPGVSRDTTIEADAGKTLASPHFFVKAGDLELRYTSARKL